MRFVKILIPLILCLAAILVLSFWLSNQKHRLHGFSNSPLLLFSVFNTIIVAIIVLSYRASLEEIDQNWQPVCEGYTQGDTIVLSYRVSSKEIDQNWQPVCEGYTQGDTIVLSYRASSEEINQNWQPVCEGYTQGNTGDYIEEDEEYHGSDGYDEDNDDDSSDDEIFWQDEEYDDNLEMRIENFIAKVYEERRKERLREIVATSSDLAKQTAMKHNYPHLN